MSSYLVDYENVSYRGLTGLPELSQEDNVYLFYTENANQVSLDMLNRMRAKLHVIRVAPGKQSLDIHLASWLGNLIGKESTPEEHYIIISNDTGFDGIISFWGNEFQDEKKIVRRNVIDPDYAASVQDQGTLTRMDKYERIRLEINDVFRKYSEKDENGKSRIRISILCNRLNHLPAYHSAKKNSGKKPCDFLADKFSDLIVLFRQDKAEWVYLASEVDPADLMNNAENTAKAVEEAASENEQINNIEPETDPDPKISEGLDTQSSSEEQNQNEPEESHSDTAAGMSVALGKEPDISQKLEEAGFESDLSDFIQPIIVECLKASSPKTMLCKQLRHVYGAKIGNEYYKTIRDTLKL